MNKIWMKIEDSNKPVMYAVFTIDGTQWNVSDLVIEQESGEDFSVKENFQKRVKEEIGTKIAYSFEERRYMDREFQKEIYKHVSYETLYKAAIEAWKTMKPVMKSPEEAAEDEA
ncbi:hypothetical protein 010DV004_247 [Bacillus phage 010DV004]|nr:hypothetical protein 010DV004_247 [Bacillus phage 010DV004]QZA69459.1 hypothetical protein 010DV005_247 [Bacillus phage 010DV005]QZA70030.1 hypothetical protein 043JT007_249 [Bacillus phage 043JT007]